MSSAKRWPLNKAYFWETAPFFRLLVPFAAGILCYDRGWVHLPGFWGVGACLFALLMFVAVVRMAPSSRGLSFVMATTMLMCMGNTYSWYNDVNNDRRWFGNLPHSGATTVHITAAPVLRPTAKDSIWRIPVGMVYQVSARDRTRVNGKAILYVRAEKDAEHFQKGDTLTVPANWERIRNVGNPFEFDYAAYCARNGIYYRQFADAEELRLYARQSPEKLSLTEKVHNWCTLQFERYIPSRRTRGLIEAMMLGDEVNLDEDIREAYAQTGIIHIIAISGGNVAIFFIVISGLLWWLKDRRHRWVKYAIALPLVWFYVVMAGSSPSAVRAAVMFSLIAFAVMFQKNSNSLNSVFATAFLLLCAQPMWLFSLGFQLSFMAVLSLILFYTHVHRWWAPSAWVARQLWPVVAASIAAQVLVAPLIIYYFHSFPLLFIIANAVAYLFMGLVIILSMAILAVSWVPALAALLGAGLGWVVFQFGRIVANLQYYSPNSLRGLLLTGFELVLVYVIIAGISTFFVRKQKPGLFIALGTSCILVFSFCVDKWQHLTQNVLVVYNITGENYVERISGNRCMPLISRNRYNRKRSYARGPVHINYQTGVHDETRREGIYDVAGKRVLVLGSPVTKGHYPVDVLVINYTGDLYPEQIKQVFAPSQVIIGAGYSRQDQQKLVNAFGRAGLHAHAVGIDGAYVLGK